MVWKDEAGLQWATQSARRKNGRSLFGGFVRCVDRYGGWPVFYEVGAETLHLYLDLGLTLLKLGEEGRVKLEGFSLEGGARKGLRYTLNSREKEGCVFEIIPQEEIPVSPAGIQGYFQCVAQGEKQRGKKDSLWDFLMKAI